MTHGSRRRAGFTLTELLAVLWAFGILLAFGVVLIMAAVRTDQVGAGTLRELSRRAELADQFRADVARADAAADRLGQWTAGPDCLILHNPDGGHIVYRAKEGQVVRTARAGDADSSRPIAVGPEGTTVEFVRPTGDGRLVVLRFVESPARGVSRRIELSAALGGDLR